MIREPWFFSSSPLRPMTGIYLDHAATSPLRPRVREAMEEATRSAWANPSSPHGPGQAARKAIEAARERIASLVGHAPREIHFVRGGTEANNLALIGRVAASDARKGSDDPAVAISGIEHASVRNPAKHLESEGFGVARLPVAPDGTIPPDLLEAVLSRRPAVLSVQAVNSECGLCLPIESVLEDAAAAGVPLHVDAVQAAGRIALPSARGRPLVMTLSGHKLGGPRSTGILSIAEGVSLAPVLHGGGQERGIRPGTEDVAGAVGIAEALALAVADREVEGARLTALREQLESRLAERIPAIRVHAREGPRAPHILSLGIPGLSSDLVLAALDLEGISASAGSACSSGVPGPGSALLSLYGSGVKNRAPLRLSLGWNTTAGEVEEAERRITRVIERLLGTGGSPTATPSTERKR